MKKIKELFVALTVRNYRLFFMGQGISLIGTWMQRTTMGWFVYRLTNSAFLLGVISFLSMIPALFISPFAGAWGDRWNRHHTLIITQSLFMLQAALLALAAISGFINADRIWPLMALSLMQGVIEAVDSPIRQSFVIDLVAKRSLLPNAIATNSAMFNSARLVGPSFGGALILLFGEGMCFAINAISYIPVIVMLFMIHLSYPARKPQSESTFTKIKEGWNYAFGHLPIRFLISNLMVFTLFGMSYSTLIPVFARDILKGTAGTQGLLLSTAGIGALCTSFYLASRKTIKGLPTVMISLGVAVSLVLIIFSRSSSLPLSLFLMLFIGLGMTMQMASTNTIIQSVVADHMRGRVLSVYTMSFMAASPFGGLLAGTLTRQFGPRNALSICAGVCLIWALFGLRLIPNIVRDIFRMLIISGNKEIYRPVAVKLNPGEV